MSTEREQMLAGALYNSRDPELLAMAQRARRLVAEFNASAHTDSAGRHAILERLFAEVGDGVWIEPPFFCDYGAHVSIGRNTFLNVNCVLLDSAHIRIGAHTQIGPGVQLLTAHHPVRAADRRVPGGQDHAGRSPYLTQASPIRIGDNVWIGGGTIVMPGVTIGDNSTVGAGSIVTRDVPANVLAFGQPCRVQREL